MQEKRFEPRMLCADLVEIFWTDPDGRRKKTVANLEDISLSGACLQSEVPIDPTVEVRIRTAKCRLEGVVRYCVFRDIGYFVGVQFAEGRKWSQREFRPQHLLDPRRLVNRCGKRTASQTIH
ncbi:MAG TPA: PilZ domain-containing protein [Bryobacteraceae bacterium]|nr:PilZ domain-containing protein [Bryobacteraceae bacterium]